jgi:hypothetical protein
MGHTVLVEGKVYLAGERSLHHPHLVPIIPIWTSSLAHAMKMITSITILLVSLMLLLMVNYEAIERNLALRGTGYDVVEEEE